MHVHACVCSDVRSCTYVCGIQRGCSFTRASRSFVQSPRMCVQGVVTNQCTGPKITFFLLGMYNSGAPRALSSLRGRVYRMEWPASTMAPDRTVCPPRDIQPNLAKPVRPREAGSCTGYRDIPVIEVFRMDRSVLGAHKPYRLSRRIGH